MQQMALNASRSDEIPALRIDLAAAFRIVHKFGWSESVGNHVSAAISDDGRTFLMNPKWRHFGSIRASELLVLDANDTDVLTRPDAPDASAWTVHGTIHRRVPGARVLIHSHTPYATALSTLKDPRLLPLDNNTARFFGDLAIDTGFGGIADDAGEGERLAAALGDKSCLLMGSHGVTVSADTVAEAFEKLYFFERAAQTMMLAYASGQPLNVLSDEVARKTAEGWHAYRGMAFEHFDFLKSELDRTDPSYRD
jgi:ribulose-5-phosphate 4-epimerase/fuculose-1-phosphate aldolase